MTKMSLLEHISTICHPEAIRRGSLKDFSVNRAAAVGGAR